MRVLLVVFTSLLLLQACKEGGGGSSKQISLKELIFVSNYEDNTISSYIFDKSNEDFKLIEATSVGNGGKPTSLAIDISGKYLYVGKSGNQLQPNLKIFEINKSNGTLSLSQELEVYEGNQNKNSINSILFSEDGRFVYIASSSGYMKAFSISPYTGKLLINYSYSMGLSSKAFLLPSGETLVWGTSGGVTLWPINKKTGEILYQGGASSISIDNFTDISFSSKKNEMYSANQGYNGRGIIKSYLISTSPNSIVAKSLVPSSVESYIGGIDTSPSGNYLVATLREKKIVQSYKIPESGNLIETSSEKTEEYPNKIRFLKNSNYFAVLNKFSNSIGIYKLNENDGSIESIVGLPTGNDPNQVISILK